MVFAQQPAYFMLGEEQFEGVQIYDMIQDLQSNYWFATDEGIFKHDGYGYERLDCPGLVGRSVFGFTINAAGTLYCHTLNHQIIKIEDGQCEVIYELAQDERSSDIHLLITPENELLVLASKALLIDTLGHVRRNQQGGAHYFGQPFLTQNGRILSHMSSQDSLLQIVGGEFKYIPLRGRAPNNEAVLVFFRIEGATFAINVRRKTLYAFDESQDALTVIADKSFLPPTEPLRFYGEHDKLWIAGSSSGVRLLDDPLRQMKAEVMYPQYFISNVFQDREGNVLLSTFDHGVIVIPDLQIPDVMAIPQAQKIAGLRRDDRLGMLLGTTQGQLLAFENDAFSSLSDAGIKPLESIFAWEGHPMVIFDDGKIKALDKRDRAIQELVQGSLKDAVLADAQTYYLALNIGVRKVVWDGDHGFDVQMVDSLQMRTYAIEYDRATQALYVATADGLKMRTASGKIETLELAGERIFATDLAFHHGKIYVATKSQGVLVLSQDRNMQQIRPMVAGQPIEVLRLAFEGDHAFAATSVGFVGIAPDGAITTQLSKANGFSTNKIRDFAFDQNDLWLLHAKGIQKLPRTQLISTHFEPKIVITEVTVNDEPLEDLQSHGKFDPTQRKIRFRLSSPTLRYRENIVYHYKLVGYESKWSTATYSDNLVVYNALGPGEYTFWVTAENRGSISEPATYAFSISAPLYARGWFIALSVVVLLLCITLIYRRQLTVQRRKTRILNELNVSKLIAIQSQMNPHFIFNALNSIQDLVLKGDVENSYSYITKFSNLVRRTLQYSERDLIDFEQEIKLLELYLSLEKLRFKKELDYEIDLDEIEADLQIPPLLIQPFVENALIHGLLHVDGPKLLTIGFALEDTPTGEVLVCVVTDNGIGREQARMIRERQRLEHESFSGKAIRNRFEILSDVYQGQFGYHYEDLVTDGKPAGTRVTLKIPIKRQF